MCASEGLKFLTCFSHADTLSSHDPVTEPCSLSVLSEFHRDYFHCRAEPGCPCCIRCLLWSLAQGCRNPTSKLPLPRIHTHGLHSCSLEVGGRLEDVYLSLRTHTRETGIGVGVRRISTCSCCVYQLSGYVLWKQREKHTLKIYYLFMCLCVCANICGYERITWG